MVEDSNKYFIDTSTDKNTDKEWRFIGFYREQETHRRVEAWSTLKGLNTQQNIHWLCARDFNELTKQDKKLGGALQSQNQMQLFRDVIDECSLMDLRFVVPKYTWSKHFENGHSI